MQEAIRLVAFDFQRAGAHAEEPPFGDKRTRDGRTAPDDEGAADVGAPADPETRGEVKVLADFLFQSRESICRCLRPGRTIGKRHRSPVT